MEETKACRKCNRLLDINQFFKKNKKYRLNVCKECSKEKRAESHRKWRSTEKGKESLARSQERAKEKKRILMLERKNEIAKRKEMLMIEKEMKRKIREEEMRKKKTLEEKLKKEREEMIRYKSSEEYKAMMKANKNKKRYERWKRAWKNNELFAIKVRLRNLVRNSFRKKGYNKFENRTESIVGITYEEFKAYIESKFSDGMTWENRGEWHIDHIIPLSTAKSEEELIKLSYYTNLQPLWAHENIKKSNKF